MDLIYLLAINLVLGFLVDLFFDIDGLKVKWNPYNKENLYELLVYQLYDEENKKFNFWYLVIWIIFGGLVFAFAILVLTYRIFEFIIKTTKVFKIFKFIPLKRRKD